MRKFHVQAGTQVSGATVISVIENVNASEIAPLVQKYGYQDIEPDQWYPLEDFHRFFYELQQRPGMMSNLVAIGMGIARTALMPPGLTNPTFEQMVEAWDDHYQSNFRNGDVGHKTTILVAPQHYQIVHKNTMMPDDLEYGVLYGFAKRFLPPGTSFTVWYDEDIPPMDRGGDQTVLHVSWE